MYIDSKKIINKLDNHQKLLSMISDKVLPIKQSLIEDVADIKRDIITSNKHKIGGNKND